MGAAEKEIEATPQSSAASSGGGNRLTLILTGVNLVATLGMVGVLFISFQRERSHPSIEDISTHQVESKGGEEKGEKKEGEAKGGEGAEGKGATSHKGSEFGKMVTLEQFTVNLSTPGSVSPKFVRVNISLEVPNEDAETEVNTKMPQVRNTVIDLFNSKRSSDLATAEGRDYLKDEIRNALNSFLVTGKVKGVFFTSFALSS